ncbi:MAG: RdgB/HAM1 family non-canonical purine NTP pyrophosphatase [Bacteroidales bacterium]|nr:RdgB/HAM1 family non-canonical purine NTP pyrophosphatase [Bacteroidales bacterium]MCM1416824.1 RdgB/HAM1 family non-canonical purine NTP pyrophosphatase [bacterium]MCM1424750.1 RdgB/HAM1 family non-canonical purine NTP pyrophosphatase [bacterium]
MNRIIFATGNEGKMREIRAILADVDAKILSMREAGANLEIEENGTSFAENALIKARAVADALAEQGKFRDCAVLADDSGLEIDALNGEPGIRSARYLGEETPFETKSKDLLRRMEQVPDEERSARFVCAIAAVFPGGEQITTKGVVEGRIGYMLKGDNGFGYDPIFYLPEYGRTAAELTDEEKNRISHRARALALMKEELKKRGF